MSDASHSRGRSMIFGIGFHRTGTTSLYRALKVLGFSSVHYYVNRLYRSPAQVITGQPDFSYFHTLQSFTDNPTPYLFRELDERFPGSRFILTVRDVESWLESVEFLFTLGREMYRWGDWEHALHFKLYGVLDSAFDKARCREVYERHNESVLKHFSGRPDDLHVIDWSETTDWNALCSFLGRDPPGIAIPHENKRPTGTRGVCDVK